MEVVRSDAIARALREERREDDQKKSLPIAGRSEEDIPPLFRSDLLESDSLLDLDEFGLDESIICVAIGMIRDEYLESFVCSVFGAKPSMILSAIVSQIVLELH